MDETEKKIELSHVDQLEQDLAKERARRVDAKVEAGTAVRAPVVAVCGGPEDADAALERAQTDALFELRRAGERREVVWDAPPPFEGQGPLVIMTGVPRPGSDEKYAARLQAELAAQTVEQRQQQEAAAAAQVESFHEGSRSHEPESPPAPMPKAIVSQPPPDAQWIATVVPVSSPTDSNPAGRSVEGRYAVVASVLYIADAAGQLITSRLLGPDDNPRAIARRVLLERLKPNPFYGDLPYKKPGTW
jgi:hypothetical protein